MSLLLKPKDHKKYYGILFLFFMGSSSLASKILQQSLPYQSTSKMAATLPQRQQQLGADHTVTSFFENIFLQPSKTSWWALQMRLMLLVLLNCSTQLQPKRYPAPLGDTDQPSISSGSDHIRSHIEPVLGISCLRSIALISSMLTVAGESPPCTQKILSSMTAASGKQSNISVQYFQTFKEPYFLKHSSQKPQTWVIWRDQWLPRRRVILDSYLTLSASRRMKVSTLQSPRSTKSPMKRQVTKGASPPILKSQRRSQNCPWMSPHTVTGESMRVRLGSLIRMSLALSQSIFTLASSMKELLLVLVKISSTTFKSLFIRLQTKLSLRFDLRITPQRDSAYLNELSCVILAATLLMMKIQIGYYYVYGLIKCEKTTTAMSDKSWLQLAQMQLTS